MFDIGQLTGESVAVKFKGKKVNSKNHAQHQVTYRERRKLAMVPVARPWEWLSRYELIDLVWKAYKVSTWNMREDAIEPMDHQDPRELREAWVEEMAKCFKDALYAYAGEAGGCWFMDEGVPQCARYAQIWKSFQDDVAPGWRPQYPLYKKVSPASARTAPGDVITADEGNRDDHDFRR